MYVLKEGISSADTCALTSAAPRSDTFFEVVLSAIIALPSKPTTFCFLSI